MDERIVSRLVTGKAKKYLRTSTAVLSLSLLVLSTFLVLVERQHQQMQMDFGSNNNVHVIEVLAGAQQGHIGHLEFGDLDRLSAALGKKLGRTGYSLSGRYELGFGIPDAAGNDRFFYGLDGDAARLLGLKGVADGTAYTVAPTRGTLQLRVPVVNVTAGGMSSAAAVDVTLAQAGGVSPNSPVLVLGPSDSQAVWVDGLTFQLLVKTAFGVDWATFTREYDADNPFGLEVVHSIYIYVDNLSNVRKAASTATSLGFSTNYTLKSFDDLAGSLRATATVESVAVLLVFLACLAYILLTLNSYMNLAHRDMGILKHFGFSSTQVRQLFSFRVASMSRLVGLFAAGYTAILGAVLLRGGARLWFSAANLAIVTASVGVVYLVTTKVVFRRHTEQDVLTLMKLNREFE